MHDATKRHPASSRKIQRPLLIGGYPMTAFSKGVNTKTAIHTCTIDQLHQIHVCRNESGYMEEYCPPQPIPPPPEQELPEELDQDNSH